MPASSSAFNTQYIAAYQALTTDLSFSFATMVLILYDILLTSGQKYRYIWRSPKSWVSRILYLWNRYMLLMYYILVLGTIPSVSNTSCVVLVWFTYVLEMLNLIGPAMFTTLRIYAFSRKNKIISGMALMLSMAPLVINASDAYLKVPINLPAPQNCSQTDTASTSLNIGLVVASRSCLILLDSLAVVITWRQARTTNLLTTLTTGIVKRRSLERVMWENGTIYFCILVSMNVVDIVLVVLSIATLPEEASSYMILFVDPISSILNSRFLLALHETNARLEGAVDASITSLSLNISSGDDPRAGSPELPQFWGPIGGLIHSLPDDDLESLEFAPSAPSQRETLRDPEAEVGGEPA